jgi:hypothetical protein
MVRHRHIHTWCTKVTSSARYKKNQRLMLWLTLSFKHTLQFSIYFSISDVCLFFFLCMVDEMGYLSKVGWKNKNQTKTKLPNKTKQTRTKWWESKKKNKSKGCTRENKLSHGGKKVSFALLLIIKKQTKAGGFVVFFSVA